MTSENKIYAFAQPAVPPDILDDADYAASSVTTTTGYVEDSEADAPYMSKAQRQTSAMAAALGQFIADNQAGTTDVTDGLAPSVLALMLLDAVGKGNLSNSFHYGINTTLTSAQIGGIVVPTVGSLAFQLPLVAGLKNGSQITFNGATYGCVISRQGSDIIASGSAGNVTALSLEANDSAVLTVINGQWSLTGGELHQGVSSSFASSLSIPGHIVYPNGCIINWVRGDSNSSGILSLPWDLPFPNALLVGWVNEANSIGWSSTNCTVWGFDKQNSNLTTAVAHVRGINGTAGPTLGNTINGTIFGIGF